MLKLRLQRRGKKNYATYRVVVAEQRAPIQGKFIKDLGFYNPHSDTFSVQAEQIQHWLAQGAQPSATVHNLLVTHGVVQGEKMRSWRPKKKATEGTSASTPSAEKPAESAPQGEATKS